MIKKALLLCRILHCSESGCDGLASLLKAANKNVFLLNTLLPKKNGGLNNGIYKILVKDG